MEQVFTLDGDIAEIIVYDTNLGASDQRDVESYLALKYGITLDISSDGYTVGATTLYAVDATFDNDIVGIGQDDSQGFNQTSSQSINASAVISLSSPASQADGEFLVLGHNNGTSTSLTGDYNGGTDVGSARIWKVEETGDVGAVTITVNQADLPGTISQIYVNNADPTLGTGGTYTALVDGGSVWTVSIDLADGDYFSFTEAPAPDINVQGNSTDIVDGSTTPSSANHTAFGNTLTTIVRTFTIQNTGTQTLTLSAQPTVTGAQFSRTADVSSLTIGIGGSETFDVTFTQGGTGVFTGSVSIASDDPDAEATYTFNINGTNLDAPGNQATGLELWLKADAGITTDVGVTTWADQGPNGNDATQTTDNNEPTLLSNALNGNPIIDFDGSDDANADEMSGTAGFYTNEYFVVVQPDVAVNGASNGFVLGFETANFGGLDFGTQADCCVANDRILHAVGASIDNPNYRAGIETGTLAAADEPFILSIRNNAGATATEMAQNGAVLTSAEFGDQFLNLSDQAYSVGDNTIGTNSYNGGLAEVISYSSRACRCR